MSSAQDAQIAKFGFKLGGAVSWQNADVRVVCSEKRAMVAWISFAASALTSAVDGM